MKRAKSLYLPAKKLFIDQEDLQNDWQRAPEARKAHLIRQYGEKGEKFNLAMAGAITVMDRHNGMYAIKDGGGRHWAVMNLLKKPDMELLCVIVDDKKIDDLDAFLALNSGLHVSGGKKFMALGADPENKYEHKICNVLKEFNLTTAPGAGWRSVKVNPVIFAHDLHLLRRVLTLVTKHWGQKKHRIEGIGICGLAGFLYIYDEDIDENRLDHVLARTPYPEIKANAAFYLPKNKEHQRQYAKAIAKSLVDAYNAHLRGKKGNGTGNQAVKPLDRDKLMDLQNKVHGMKNYEIFSQVWEMRKAM